MLDTVVAKGEGLPFDPSSSPLQPKMVQGTRPQHAINSTAACLCCLGEAVAIYTGEGAGVCTLGEGA